MTRIIFILFFYQSVFSQNEKDQIENFESMNMAYVLEEKGKVAAIEFKNVKLWIKGAWH